MSYRNPGLQMSVTRGQHSFAQVPQAQIQRSVFNRSNGLKTAFDAGFLIPIFVDEALPGDTMQMNVTAFGRIATLINPIMDNMYLDMFFFSVPNRLLWDNWEKFNGEQRNPGDSTAFLLPQIGAQATGYAAGSIGDYMGLPILVNNTPAVSALPFRAYNLIWNEWFRDENLQTSLTNPTTDGPDSITLYALQKRGKRHDYFTSCLPFAQKGTAVSLPLGTTATVFTATAEHTTTGAQAPLKLRRTTDNAQPTNVQLGIGNVTAGEVVTFGSAGAAGVSNYPTNLYANLATATAATINQLREAFQVQRLLERDARGGTRYTEILKSHFGVTSPDARLQRPEYLGGGTVMINVNPIAATTDGTAKVGDLGAAGTYLGNASWRQSFTEHATIIGLACLRADLNYQQGIDRMWNRRTRYDFYWPAFAHLGEQAVLNKEIWVSGVPATDDAAFGYQERWAEYRYKPSKVTGRMRSDSPTPLDSWHLAQDFAALPALNAAFIVEDPPVDRVIAVPSEPHAIADFYFNYKSARPMPVFSVPGLIDHF